MVPRDNDPLTEPDPHALLFGTDEDSSHEQDYYDGASAGEQTDAYTGGYPARDGYTGHGVAGTTRRPSRAHRRQARRHRRTFTVLAVVLAIVLVVIGVVGFTAYQHRYHPKDYAGQGTGSVRIVIKSGDSAAVIGDTLVKAGVVRTARAFSNAASKNSDAQQLSPGTYLLHSHMSASSALGLLLDPTSRVSASVVVFPGATVIDVADAMSSALGVSVQAATAALADVSNLGLPSGYTNGSALTSVEGFLYPATYTFDPGAKPADAVQEMITKFIDVDRSAGFAAKAKAAHLTPYAALIIASIAEKEAKMPADYARVARVILNRIAAHMPLQIDATSAYAAKLQHLDPTKVIYAQIPSPYNTYTHDGLPPTPIANPGDAATAAAIHPAAGNWLYYVNSDKQGDLFFTNDPAAFDAAVARCQANNWGCG